MCQMSVEFMISAFSCTVQHCKFHWSYPQRQDRRERQRDRRWQTSSAPQTTSPPSPPHPNRVIKGPEDAFIYFQKAVLKHARFYYGQNLLIWPFYMPDHVRARVQPSQTVARSWGQNSVCSPSSHHNRVSFSPLLSAVTHGGCWRRRWDIHASLNPLCPSLTCLGC